MDYSRYDKKNKILAESDHYYILAEYEKALLYIKKDSKLVACVGDFYGDPQDAYIDSKEEYCITVGCGIVLYYLLEPFEDYKYNQTSEQWIETGRDGEILWCDRIEKVEDGFFTVSLENGGEKCVQLGTLKLI